MQNADVDAYSNANPDLKLTNTRKTAPDIGAIKFDVRFRRQFFLCRLQMAQKNGANGIKIIIWQTI